MRNELGAILSSINDAELLANFADQFRGVWNVENSCFHSQESFVIDYKETIPESFSDSYGSSVIRLALAFHNSFGGVIIFGVKDRTLEVTGLDKPFEIERLNRALSDFTGVHIECVSKRYEVQGLQKFIAAVLVPKRGYALPVRLTQTVDRYPEGALFVRERHEVLTASARHFPMLYGIRSRLPSENPNTEPLQIIHRSLPPSPTTMREFVGRAELLNSLWKWFIFSDQPRLYLFGPGGSGKTTLAFEFARLLAETDEEIYVRPNEKLDYVVFISGKETEFDPFQGKERVFSLKQFSNADEQISQILYHSGMATLPELVSMDSESQGKLLETLCSSYNGLIVVDDIDALTRRGIDTSEESLFLKAVLGAKKTRVLYTIRQEAAHARRSSLNVSGLAKGEELEKFIRLCAETFVVPLPSKSEADQIAHSSHQLPLLIETIMWLRKFSGNYANALSEFSSKGGDEARRYLYQREYDRLDQNGKSRYLIAGLALLDAPMTVSSICNLFRWPIELVRESINESAGIFLTALDDDSGETSYKLSPPAVPFVATVSTGLPMFGSLKRTVEVFLSESPFSTPKEAALISAMRVRLRVKDFHGVLNLSETLARDDPALVNPIMQSLIGIAYANLGPDFREKARSAFRHSNSLAFTDVFMMRAWYHLELTSGYGLSSAADVCKIVIDNPRTSSRHLSEFLSKLAYCNYKRSESLRYTDREKYIASLRESIAGYLAAIDVGRDVREIDITDNLRWLDRPLGDLAVSCYYEPDQYLSFLEAPGGIGRDIPSIAVDGLVANLLRLKAPKLRNEVARWQVSINRTIGRIRKQKVLSTSGGMASLVERLQKIAKEIDKLSVN